MVRDCPESCCRYNPLQMSEELRLVKCPGEYEAFVPNALPPEVDMTLLITDYSNLVVRAVRIP